MRKKESTLLGKRGMAELDVVEKVVIEQPKAVEMYSFDPVRLRDLDVNNKDKSEETNKAESLRNKFSEKKIQKVMHE